MRDHFVGDATGVSPEKDLPATFSLEGNNLVWKAPYGSRSTPLVMNGRVYFINYAAEQRKEKGGKVEDVPITIQERVMCLDANTGKLLWEHKFNVWHVEIVTVRLYGYPQGGRALPLAPAFDRRPAGVAVRLHQFGNGRQWLRILAFERWKNLCGAGFDLRPARVVQDRAGGELEISGQIAGLGEF